LKGCSQIKFSDRIWENVTILYNPSLKVLA